MNKIATLIAKGEITVEDLASANELIERAELVMNGIEACKKTLSFSFGVSSIYCYSYTDRAGEYEASGECFDDGTFICYCNWGGYHEIGRCNLTNFAEVFMAFENREFACDLRRFLLQQIEKAN